MQAQRKRADCLEIGRNVLTDAAVATGSSALENTVAVIERNCKPVNFQFANVRHVGNAMLLRELADALVERSQLFFTECISQTQHWAHVLVWHKALGRRRPNALRRRIRRL